MKKFGSINRFLYLCGIKTEKMTGKLPKDDHRELFRTRLTDLINPQHERALLGHTVGAKVVIIGAFFTYFEVAQPIVTSIRIIPNSKCCSQEVYEEINDDCTDY
ncbi:MAG: hypothetical protein LBB79_08455 [Prevotellaceae bacterium]|nr:hypothetical protein [Prevotellaceae bacterium]